MKVKCKIVHVALAAMLQLLACSFLLLTAPSVVPGANRRIFAAVDRQGRPHFQGIRHRC